MKNCIRNSLLSIKSIESKGQKKQRNLYAAIALGLMAISPVSFAAKQVLNEQNISMVTQGGDVNRHVLKTLGRNNAVRLNNDWPNQLNKKVYSQDELNVQYEAANATVEKLKKNIDTLVDVEGIHYYPTYEYYKKMKNIDESNSAPSIVTIGESPFSLKKTSLLSSIGFAAEECIVVVPHINDEKSSVALTDLIYGDLLTTDPQSKTDVIKYILYHETAHCFHVMMKDSNMNLFNQIIKSAANDVPAENIKKITDAANESVADSFAAFKIQQDYYAQNKDQIINREVPEIAPILSRLITSRQKLHYTDSIHDTSPAIKEIIDQLSKPGQLERLANASDANLMMISYGVLDKTFQELLANNNILDKYYFSFSKDYKNTMTEQDSEFSTTLR